VARVKTSLGSGGTPLAGGAAEGTRQPRGSLARRTLLKMGVRVAAVVVALTAISYYHVMSTITRQALDDLQNYIQVRGDREQSIFDLAYDNHQAIKTELIKRIHDYDGKDPSEEFQRRYMTYADGAVGTRPDLYDPARMAGVGIHNPGLQILDADLKRRVLAAQDTIEQMGQALHPRFQNTYLTMPENINIGYWPEEPKGPFTMRVAANYRASEVFRIADPERNPERKSVWSRMYRDRTKKAGLVSLSTPVYEQDRFLGVIGHDITLSELLDRTVNVRLEGTYNFIVGRDGALIAHPSLTSAIERADGKLNVANVGDPELQRFYEAALTVPGEVGVLENTRGNAYLGVVRIRGPGWYLITVYPKELLQQAAYSTARVVLLGGLVSLILEMLILYLVLREQVAEPLHLLLGATKRVASGDRDVKVDTGRNDELGELAMSFNRMTDAILDREAHSKRVEETLRQSEERFRLLFERSADALLLLDGEEFIDCNDAAVALMKCERTSDLISRRLADLSPEEQPDGSPSVAKASDLHRLAFDRGSHRFEWRVKRPNGEEFPMEGLITSIPFRGKPILYAVFRDITERKQAEENNRQLTEEIAENLKREIEKNQLLERLRATVDVLSTPVLEVWKEILSLPLVGAIDDRRSNMMMEKVLYTVAEKPCRYVIIDITGVPMVDTATANRLLKLATAVELLGARCVLTGIGPNVAQTLVSLRVPMQHLATLRTPKDALRACLKRIESGAPPALRGGHAKSA
jgi:PAS domain S-box-containing protein